MQDLRATVKFQDLSAGDAPGPGRVRFLTDAAAAALLAADDKRRRKATAISRRERAAERLRERADEIAAELGVDAQAALQAARSEVREARLASIVDNMDAADLAEAEAVLADRMDRVRLSRYRTAETNEMLAERLGTGYVWLAGDGSRSASPHGGAAQAGFVHHGFKSADHPTLARFAAALPKAGKGLMVGRTKADLKPATVKALALDMPYVEGNKALRGFWRVDNDGVFESWWHLWDDLLQLGVPMPDLAVADVLSDGRIVKPHLYWLAPIGSGVRFDDGAPKHPKALWGAILRALHLATVPLGSDMGGTDNPMRGKSPLSPHFGVAILRESDPLSMSEMARRLERWMNVPDAVAAKAHSAAWSAQGGVAPTVSNELWSSSLDACWATVRAWRETGDVRGTLKGKELADELIIRFRDSALKALGPSKAKQGIAIVASACRFVGKHYDPTKAGGLRMRRGVLDGELGGMDLKARQRAGQAFVAADRHDGTVEAIRAAHAAIVAEGRKATQAAVAQRVGKGLRTVARRWDEAIHGVVEEKAIAVAPTLSPTAPTVRPKGPVVVAVPLVRATPGPKATVRERAVAAAARPSPPAHFMRPSFLMPRRAA